MKSMLPIGGLCLALITPVWAQTSAGGKIEVLADALPSVALTNEAARNYNVTPAPGRGLLTLALARGAGGKSGDLPAQVYAGVINQQGYPMSIPMREVREGESVLYVGEFHYQAPDNLHFLVNVNVLGQQVRAEFNRAFPH